MIWLGQTASSFGSALTGFALGVWVFQAHGSVTEFGLLLLASALPRILLSPFAGALVDRWNRRRVMIFADCVAALSTLVVLLLVTSGRLEVWHLYVTTTVNSSSRAFQGLAYTAAAPLLVPKEQLGRASGMVQLSMALAELLSPVVAGFLLGVIGLNGVILVDFATFFFALFTLLTVRVPDVPKGKEATGGKSLLHDATYGWVYLRQRPGLMALLIFFFITNMGLGFLQVLVTPLVLSFSSARELGVVATLSGIGMLIGSLLMTAWGGSKHLVRDILAFSLLQGVALMIGGLRENLVLITIAGFSFLFFNPLIASSSRFLWQRKVAPEVQGRVFAMRQMIAWMSLPLAYVVAGPFVDAFCEPLLQPGGALASTVGRLIGVGPGRGTAFFIMSLGAMMVLASVVGYGYPRLRRVEEEIPDALPDETPEAPVEEVEVVDEAAPEGGAA